MKMVQETDNPGLLQSIKNLFKKESKVDFWSSLSEHEKKEVRMGIEEADKGEVLDYNLFMKKHRKLYS